MLTISDQAIVALDVRLGRSLKAQEFFAKHPQLWNEKIFPASELGVQTHHALIDMAVNFGHTSLFKWALEKKAICAPFRSPSLLLLATAHQNKEMCDMLIDRGFDPWVSPSNHGPTTPLSVAVSLGWMEGLQGWKKKGVSLKRDIGDHTLYHELFDNLHNYNKKTFDNMVDFFIKNNVAFRPNNAGEWPQDRVKWMNQDNIHREWINEAVERRERVRNQKVRRKIEKNVKVSPLTPRSTTKKKM